MHNSRRRVFRHAATAMLALGMLHAGASLAQSCDAHAASHDAATAVVSPEARDASSHDGRQGHQEHHGSSAPSTPSAPSAPADQCDDSADRDCCVGMTSCAWDFRADVLVAKAPVTLHGTVDALTSARPHSQVTAPEPPPPRG